MTTEALVWALIAVVRRKGWEALTVQDLATEAGISRSTFYSHYRDKDDLLFRSFEAMLLSLDRSMNHAGNVADRVAPVAELFHHMSSNREFHSALDRARMIERHYRVGIDVFSRTIAQRLAARRNGAGTRRGHAPATVQSVALAGALFALLRWWLDQGAQQTPEAMDQKFHELIR